MIDVSARTLKLLQFVWMASDLLRLVAEMAATEHSDFSPFSMPPPICVVMPLLATVVVATEWPPYCITLLRSFFMLTAGNVFSCDLKNPVIFVCDPKFGGLKMCCGVALPLTTFGAIGVPTIVSFLSRPTTPLPLAEFGAIDADPPAVLLLPSHAECFAAPPFVDALLSDRLRFDAIELDSIPVELPRIRFGLIVLIDVNNDNNGAVDVVVDNIFVGFVCASVVTLTATAFLGDADEMRVLLIVLIDDTDAFNGGFTNVEFSTSGFAATNPDAIGRFEREWVCFCGFWRLKFAIKFSKSSLDGGLYGEPGFDASSLDVALESVQLNVATPLEIEKRYK